MQTILLYAVLVSSFFLENACLIENKLIFQNLNRALVQILQNMKFLLKNNAYNAHTRFTALRI